MPQCVPCEVARHKLKLSNINYQRVVRVWARLAPRLEPSRSVLSEVIRSAQWTVVYLPRLSWAVVHCCVSAPGSSVNSILVPTRTILIVLCSFWFVPFHWQTPLLSTKWPAHALQVGGSRIRWNLRRNVLTKKFGIKNLRNIAQTIFSIDYYCIPCSTKKTGSKQTLHLGDQFTQRQRRWPKIWQNSSKISDLLGVSIENRKVW